MAQNETTPVLLDGFRTPFGRLGGGLKGIPTRELIAAPMRRLIETYPSMARPDGVLLGQVLQGGHGQNPARLAAAAAGVEWSVPASTLNNVCLAGLATLCDASRRIRLGEGSSYIAGGGDSMSRSAHAALIKPEMKLGSVEFADTMITDGLYCSLTDEGMGELSERANPSFGISRKVQDEIAYQSHQRAAEAVQRGRLAKEIVETGSLVQDEGIRKSATREGVAALQPAFAQDGTITAGNASQMSDGASVGVVISAAEAERIGVSPLARIVSFAEVAGPDNTLHLKPATAIRAVCERAQVKVSDVDLFEINEAFAAVVAASVDDLGLSMETVNPNGGAISLGHPLGGTGMRLLITLAHELSHRDLTYGIAALCGGGGQGLAVLIERSAR